MQSLLEKFKDFIDISPNTPRISLGEGNTPLVWSRMFDQKYGFPNVYFKLESCNPTGSFKDRGMVVAVAKALEKQAKVIICSSTGNTSASASAYGGRYGLKTVVLIPSTDVPISKLSQAMICGAHVVRINGSFDNAMAMVKALDDSSVLTVVNSINTDRIEGQKTAAFEIVDDLGDAPDYVCLPVGNGGNIYAYWQGFRDFALKAVSSKEPKLMGFQASGSAPIVDQERVLAPETIASAIRIGNPANWDKAVMAVRESSGLISKVTDREIIDAWEMLASQEGIFCEPSSAAGVAGLLKLIQNQQLSAQQSIVCIITGTGLKDVSLVEHSDIQQSKAFQVINNLPELQVFLRKL